MSVFSGVLRWIARRGAVGGTARWAGRSYKRILKSNPDASQEEICIFLVEHRYKNDQDKKMLHDHFAYVKRTLGDSEINLHSLVMGILMLEAGFADLPLKTQELFNEVIKEELHKLKLPNKVIYGESRAEMMASVGISTL